MLKHITVGLFVPHKGCPHQCSFCNQKSISGKIGELTADEIRKSVEIALENPKLKNAEIAFFGGSFTAIERDYMISLLKTASEYIDGDKFKGIRVSTRPDAISDEICEILKHYGVTAVELGAQSMDDEVLRLNNRGHNSKDVKNAVKILKSHSFETGLQMMTGLYGSTKSESIETAKKIIDLSPDTVRVYPTVVLENTYLQQLYNEGKYIPQTVEEAVDICAEILPMFYENSIRVIRVGLHSGGDVENGFVAGAYHPAFKEKCDSKIYYKKILEKLENGDFKCPVVYVPKGATSQAVGQKKENLQNLYKKGYNIKVKETNDLEKYQVLVKENLYDT